MIYHFFIKIQFVNIERMVCLHMPADENKVWNNPGRAIVVCERWLGSNAFAMMNALRLKQWNVTDFCEKEYVPLRWKARYMKVAGRILRERAAREFNNAILQTARQYVPDMFLVFKGRYVFASTIKSLKELGVKTYCVYPDVSFQVHGRHIPEALPCYDWVFTTKSFGVKDMRDQLGVTRSDCILHAADADLHRPVTLSSRDMDVFGCDVSFIGTWSQKKERLLKALIRRLPKMKLKVFGSQWDQVAAGSPLKPFIPGHPVYSLDYVKAIRASKINLAILSEARTGASSGDQITSRTFHIPASGGFMLHERTDELLQVFKEGEHMGCFADSAEIAEKVAFFLDHAEERKRIRKNGHLETCSNHTWDQRIGDILAKHHELLSLD
jgi:hypothetical protein